MQITDEMVEVAADFDARFDGHESLSVLGRVHRDRYLARSRAALEAALGASQITKTEATQAIISMAVDIDDQRACIEDLAGALNYMIQIQEAWDRPPNIFNRAIDRARAALEKWGLK